MRRGLGIFIAIAAIAAVGCSSKDNKFDQNDTNSGNGAGTNSATTTGGTTGVTTTGSGSTSTTSSSSGSTGTTGEVDAGPCADLTGATLSVFSLAPNSLNAQGQQGAVTQASLVMSARFANGFPATTCPVSFVEQVGETLVSLTPSLTAVDAVGNAATQITSGSQTGTAHIVVTLGDATTANNVTQTVTINIGTVSSTDAGPPTPSSIGWVSTVVGSTTNTPTQSNPPALMGIAGSGINEQGSMTFQVQDQNSKPIQGVSVSFDQQAAGTLPDGGAFYYVNFSGSSGATPGHEVGTTDNNGDVSVVFQSGPQVGIAQVQATVVDSSGALTNVTTNRTIPVRGAKPSAAHFHFVCDHLNLPVYTTVQESEQMLCHVALADRFSNPIGIPTNVTFHTEAGTIQASAQTVAFDQTNPSGEGTADVVFTSNMANGFTPADVVPLANEPSYTDTSTGQTIVKNPRDRLVTIIAITQGEEAFSDANNNNQYDPGEQFFDMGDPFIDANDDNQFDTVSPGGASETRYCSTQNPTQCGPGYSYGNGTWDATATIWTSTHVVFSGAAALTNKDTLGAVNTTNVPHNNGQGTIAVYGYDDYDNLPAPGTTFTATLLGTTPGLTMTPTLSSPILDALGTINLTYVNVAESDGGACIASNGTACLVNTAITGFDHGAIGTLTLTDTNTMDGGGFVPFSVSTTTTNAHSVVVNASFLGGTYQQ